MLKLIVSTGNGTRLFQWVSDETAEKSIGTANRVTTRLATPDEIEANSNVFWGDDCPGDDDGIHIMQPHHERCQRCGQPHPATEK